MKRSAAFIALLCASACSQVSKPVIVPSQEIPFNVSRVTQTIQPGAPIQFTVAFVRQGRLLPLPRDLPVLGTPEETALHALFTGPTTRERERGITSEIPTDVSLLAVRIVDRVAQINVSREFQAAGASGSILLRVAQVVRTATGIAGVTAVLFSIDGESVSVPTDSGHTVDRPVSRVDYASVSPRPSSG